LLAWDLEFKPENSLFDVVMELCLRYILLVTGIQI